METMTLQSAQKGRSRFSKALPAPPPEAPWGAISNTAPQLPPIPTGLPISPRPPPKMEVTPAKPLDSQLPALPFQTSPGMAIPRRPVGRDSTKTSAPEELSPVSSLTDLLSAYSNRTSNTTWRTSEEGVASNFGTEATSSSQKDSHFTLGAKDGLERTQLAVPSASNGRTEFTREARTQARDPAEKPQPQIPQQQQQQQQSRSGNRPSTPPQDAFSSQARSSGSPARSNPSPPQPQLWRRRSILAERSIAVAELKLTSSHGSTASTQPPPTTQQPEIPSNSLVVQDQLAPTASTPASSRLLPPSANGLPGKNIRPVTTPRSGEMGNEVSRIKKKLKDSGLEDEEAAAAAATGSNALQPLARTTKTTTAVSPLNYRPPTPEYARPDLETPIFDNAVTTVSPASSPEVDTDAGLPVPRKAIGLPTREMRPAKSDPTLSQYGNGPAATGLSRSFDARAQAQPPFAPVAARRDTEEQGRFPIRTSSSNPAALGLPRGSQGNLAAESKPEQLRKAETQIAAGAEKGDSTPSDERRDSDVEEPFEDLFPEGYVFPALPLVPRHFQCWMRHRQLHINQNTVYPISCQVCHSEDTAERFTCSWCFLRICQNCRVGLGRVRGDLPKLLEQVEASKVANGANTESPIEPVPAPAPAET